MTMVADMGMAMMQDGIGLRRWGGAFTLVGGGHVMAAVAVATMGPSVHPVLPDPVMIVELPTLPPPSAAMAVARPVPASSTPVTSTAHATPDRVEAPVVTRPIPADAVRVAVKPVLAAPSPVAAPSFQPASAPAVTPVAATPAQSSASSIGDDPKARQAQANYFQTLMAYLARRKAYPAEAKKAGQQGVVTVRFSVDRNGHVSEEAIKRGSGHSLLDGATLALVRRVSPMPPMPASMRQERITVSLPIEYSLTSK